MNVSFARATRSIVVTMSQIDRAFERGGKAQPDLSDVRLPNPVDLTLFTKACSLHDGKFRVEAVS